MDHYGIGNALMGAARIYFQTARQTGRTTSLLQSLKDGDRIATNLPQEAARLRRELAHRGLKVEVIVLDTAHPDPTRFGTPQGRTLLDHTWVEQFYVQALQRAAREVDEIQALMTGWGEAHERMRAAALEWHDANLPVRKEP